MRVAVGVGTLVLTVALASTGPARAEVEWSPVTGEFTARYMGYDENSPREDRNHFGEGELRIEITGRLTESLQLVAVPLLQYDTGNKTADQFRFHEDELQRPAATFEELYVTWYGDKYEVAVGKQIFAWGVSAGLKPTDNLSAADFLDVPTLHKVGVPAISFLRSGKVDVQVVIAPLFSPNRLPLPDNRWAIVPQDALDAIEAVTGFEPPILIEATLPEHDANNAQVGVRFRSSSLVDGWDLELSAFHGHDPFGLFDAALVFPPVRVEVETFYPEYTDVGGGFSTAAGKFTFHGETAYHRTMNDIDDDYLQYVAGFDYSMDMGGPGALDRLLLGLEYAGETVDNENTRPRSTFATGFDRVFTNSVLGLLDFVFSEDTSIRVGGTVNFNNEDFVTRAQVTHKLIENLRLQAGVDILSGPSDSFYGNWQENDRLFVFTTYYF